MQSSWVFASFDQKLFPVHSDLRIFAFETSSFLTTMTLLHSFIPPPPPPTPQKRKKRKKKLSLISFEDIYQHLPPSPPTKNILLSYLQKYLSALLYNTKLLYYYQDHAVALITALNPVLDLRILRQKSGQLVVWVWVILSMASPVPVWYCLTSQYQFGIAWLASTSLVLLD